MANFLDLSALRTLVAIADCGGYHRAAETLRLSQSTVSQHVRKLEKTLHRTLLEPDGRGMRFTPDGELLLAEARPLLQTHDAIMRRFTAAATTTVVVGSTEHAADHLLPHIVRAFDAELPDDEVRFRLDRGSNLSAGLDNGTIDVAILLGSAHANNIPAGSLPLTWYAAPDWQPPPSDEPLPLVVIDGPCTVRRRAIETLTMAGRSHKIAAEAGYLAGVVNAVRAGVGVALMAGIGPAPTGLVAQPDLPAVSPEPLHVRMGTSAPAHLARVVTSAVQSALGAPNLAAGQPPTRQNSSGGAGERIGAASVSGAASATKDRSDAPVSTR